MDKKISVEQQLNFYRTPVLYNKYWTRKLHKQLRHFVLKAIKPITSVKAYSHVIAVISNYLINNKLQIDNNTFTQLSVQKSKQYNKVMRISGIDEYDIESINTILWTISISAKLKDSNKNLTLFIGLVGNLEDATVSHYISH